MTQSLVDPSALVADSVDAASPAAAAGSAPDPAATIAAPPLPVATSGPSVPAPPIEPPPLPDASAGALSPPALPIAGAQASAPASGQPLLQQLFDNLPQIVTAVAASRMHPAAGAGLLDGYVRGHQATVAEKMQRDEFEQHKQQQAASFVEHATTELATIAQNMGPAAYAQAVSLYKQLAPSFGIKPETFDTLAHANSDVVSEKQREKLQQIYEKALKNLPDDMPPEERARAIVQVPGLGPMPLGHLATLAGQPSDPKTGAAIIPDAPDAPTPDRQAIRNYARKVGKTVSQLTPAEIRQAREEASPKGLEQKNVYLDGKPALVLFDPASGKSYQDTAAGRIDVSGRVAPYKDPDLTALQRQSLELTNALKQMQQGQQPTKDDAHAIAQQLVDNKMAPSQLQLLGGFGASGQAFKRMVLLEAQKISPDFNLEEAESTYQLAKSPGFQQTVRYMDSVRESLPRLQASAQALANGNIRGINVLLNAGKDQVNNVSLKKFQTDRLFLADEVAKILQGGGTGSATSDAKLNQAASVLKDSDSPQAIAAALEEVQALIGFRRKALTRGTYLEDKGGAKPTGRFNPVTGKIEPVK